jgi:uncharacterized membrane protein YtjA (UPF0391 family)
MLAKRFLAWPLRHLSVEDDVCDYDSNERRESFMLNWSITFLVIGLIAGVLGFTGVAGAATQIAWILFVVFLVLFLISLVMGRGRVS